MFTRRGMVALIVLMTALAVVRAFVPTMQRTGVVWLLAVSALAPWVVWHCAKQLYTAAMHGYLLTGAPEDRVYRDENPSLFRNNVVGYIVMFPGIAAGAVVVLMDALRAEQFIR